MGFARKALFAGGLAALANVATRKTVSFAPVLDGEFTYTAGDFTGMSGLTIEGRPRRSVTIMAHDGLELSGTIFDVDDPVGVVHVVHGILEHKERYYPLLEYLQDHDWASIVVDMRGHGSSINATYRHGHLDGTAELIDDLLRVQEAIHHEYPGIPISMLAHSFGTVLARLFLARHDKEIDKLAMTGTVGRRGLAYAGIHVAPVLEKLTGGPYGASMLMTQIEEGVDWLAYDEEVIRAAQRDPLMLDRLTNRGGYTLWHSLWELRQTEAFRCEHPELPILSMTGDADLSVTGGADGLMNFVEILERIGYENVSSVVYPDMKHEVLNETDKAIVWADLLAFLDDDIIPQI